MKILHFFRFIGRLLYRVSRWGNAPISEEQLRWVRKISDAAGYKRGVKETLEKPIMQIPLKQATEPLYLPPGEWSRRYYEVHPEHRAPLPSSPLRTRKLLPQVEFVGDSVWLNSSGKHMTPAQIAITKVDTNRDLTEGWDKDKTEERTAIDKLLYQGRQERRQRQAG